MRIALISLAFLVVPCLAQADDTLKLSFKEPIQRIEVENASGEVFVHAGDSTQVTARHKDCTGHAVEARVEGATLRVRFDPERRHGRQCSVDFDISVPANIETRVDVGSGDVRIQGVRGAVAIESGSGDVVLDGEIGKLSVDVGSGDVRANGLVESARVQTGSGAVKLGYRSVPAQGALKVESGSGDVALSLPEKAQVRVHFDSGSGSLRGGFKSTQGAGFSVTVQTGSGDLSIASK